MGERQTVRLVSHLFMVFVFCVLFLMAYFHYCQRTSTTTNIYVVCLYVLWNSSTFLCLFCLSFSFSTKFVEVQRSADSVIMQIIPLYDCCCCYCCIQCSVDCAFAAFRLTLQLYRQLYLSCLNYIVLNVQQHQLVYETFSFILPLLLLFFATSLQEKEEKNFPLYQYVSFGCFAFCFSRDEYIYI